VLSAASIALEVPEVEGQLVSALTINPFEHLWGSSSGRWIMCLKFSYAVVEGDPSNNLCSSGEVHCQED